MRLRLISALAAVAGMALAGAPAAQAQPVKFGLCYDLSKAYTFVTPQIVQAAKDYADIVNAKGGIEGHPVEIIVQDHGNEPQRGIECYEKLKREGVMMFDMLSTPVSRAVLPRVMADGNILLQSFVGRGDAIDGDVFKWVFPIGPPTGARSPTTSSTSRTSTRATSRASRSASSTPTTRSDRSRSRC